MAKPSVQLEKDDLEQRINAIHAEIDALIDAHARQVAKDAPGVPLGVIRQTIVGNEPCQCAAFTALSESGALR